MAGIEKICEFSGEYPGYLMYGYKHNQLQIMPKYRKLFRGCDCELLISVNSVKLTPHKNTNIAHIYAYSLDDTDTLLMPDYIKKHLKAEYELNTNDISEWARYALEALEKSRIKGGKHETVLLGYTSLKNLRKQFKLTHEYKFILKVKNPELEGNVKGKYLNWSYNKSTVLRKMKRLTRNYKLKFKNVVE